MKIIESIKKSATADPVLTSLVVLILFFALVFGLITWAF